MNLVQTARKPVALLLAITVLLWTSAAKADVVTHPMVTVGSKKFTESVILGEMISLLAEHAGGRVTHRRELGGTRVLWNALIDGSIDMYPEYTGTLREEIFVGQAVGDEDALRKQLAVHGVRMSEPMGFNNTYAIGINPEQANKLEISTLSNLRDHPKLRFGFTSEFMDRGDGWPSLRDAYRLPQQDVRGMDHDLCYRALAAGGIDLMDMYATDAEISYYNLVVLRDDLQHFPRYEAVLLYREELADRAPAVLEQVLVLGGSIDERSMTAINARVKLDGVPETLAAADFLRKKFGVDVKVDVESIGARLWRTTCEHLFLVLVSLSASILVGIPLGVIASKKPRLGQMVLGVVGVVQTIPALALLVLLMTLLRPLSVVGVESIGAHPAIAALFLYSLLPIVRNTYTGLMGIPLPLRESAMALGLSGKAQLLRVELPLALPTLLAGVKTAAVLNIGFATLGALIGAGGYGQPILTGIRLDNISLILQGALPAAGLAILAQGLFELFERTVVSRGLRLRVRE